MEIQNRDNSTKPGEHTAVECLHLCKSYRRTAVLKDLSFSIQRGEFAALTGPKGAGKTTLLKILASLILPSSGELRIFGKNPSSGDKSLKARLGFVSSEERSFFWRLTGRQNLFFFASLYNLERLVVRERIESLLLRFGMKEMGDVPFRKYSSGMKQTLNLIRAFIHEPDIFLLDEPTRSLHQKDAATFWAYLNELKDSNGITVMIASHNPTETTALADKIFQIDQGCISPADGPAAENT
jgi:ABC-2 type transport system ATP-binding protein